MTHHRADGRRNRPGRQSPQRRHDGLEPRDQGTTHACEARLRRPRHWRGSCRIVSGDRAAHAQAGACCCWRRTTIRAFISASHCCLATCRSSSNSGVLEKVRAIGVRKLGADFPSSAGSYQTFHFRRALGHSPDHAFQVRREEFDLLLFENARACGVDAQEGVKVEEVSVSAIGAVTARACDADGKQLQIVARYLIDASGRDTVLGNQLKLKRKNVRHQSAAIFAHYQGVRRRPGEDAGNISIYNFEFGWCWFIPLRDDVMSIGCVCWPEYLKQRKGANEAFLTATLQRMPEAWVPHGRCTDRRRYPGYRELFLHLRAHGRAGLDHGRRCLGFRRSGVFLRRLPGHAQRHARSRPCRCLPARSGARGGLQRDFDRRIRRGVRVFSWFIYRFNSPVMRALFAHPRNSLRVEEGVISMLAGDVFDSPAVMRRVRIVPAHLCRHRAAFHAPLARRARCATASGACRVQRWHDTG